MRSMFNNPSLGFVKDIPWLFYLDNPTDVITKADIKLEVTFNKKSTTKVNKLDFYLAAYDINGKYLGLYALTNQLLLCPNSAAAGDIISSFGTSVELACEIDLTVFNQTETIFYEMFLKDSDGTFKDVPVKVLNFRDSIFHFQIFLISQLETPYLTQKTTQHHPNS